MSKKQGIINWTEPSTEIDRGYVPEFKKFCLEFYPRKDKTLLNADIDNFSSATESISNHFEKFFEKISNLPLISLIVFWAENVSKGKFRSVRNIHMMQQLIINGFIGLKDTRGQTWTLKHMVSMGHNSILEAIRSNEIWSIEETEEYVEFYTCFVNWLSEKTFGYVPLAVDAYLNKTKQRKLPLRDFITIVKNLADRERAIAQLLYYGGSRSFEEILSLKIENVDVTLGQVVVSDCIIEYPKHVLKTLQAYIGGRKKGYVFIGKQGEKIDRTVPYRALKTIASKLGLDASFTFKDFATDIG